MYRAVKNDVESIAEGGGGGAKGTQFLRVTPVAARHGGEMEVSGEQIGLRAEAEERKGGVVR